MEPSMVDLVGGGLVAILVIDRVGNLLVDVFRATTGKNGSSPDAKLAAAIENIGTTLTSIAKEQQKSSALISTLDTSHHGPGAYDKGGRYRWHGGENTDETRKVAEQIKELRRETRTGHESIVAAIESHGDAT